MCIIVPYTERSLYKIGGWIWTPEVHPWLFRIPDSGHIGRIIPDLLDIAHEFYHVLLRISEVFKLVLAGAMPAGAIEQRITILHEVFSLLCQRSEERRVGKECRCVA